MKPLKAAFFLFLILFVFQTYAQETTRIYEVRSNIPVFACNLLGQRLYKDNRFSIPRFGSKFAVVRSLANDTTLVRFLTWDASSSDPDAKYGYENFNKPLQLQDIDNTEWLRSTPGIDTMKIERYFLMADSDIDSNCIKVFAKGPRSTVFTLGLVTMPMKLRLGKNFDFQGTLSLGTTAGIKMRMSPYNPNFINILIGTSISTISLDSFSTKGKVTGQPLTNIAVFSPSIGVVFEFGRAQAGVFYGWDILNKATQSQYGWIHNKKPWLSVGFGFSIFNINSNSSNSQSQTQ